MIPASVRAWVEEVRALCQPDNVHWCDGSEEERARLTAEAVRDGVLLPLNGEKLPNSYLHRSDPTDVARTEHLTFICTSDKDDAGPNNNWMAPADAKAKLAELYKGAMKGRTLYVVPFVMGPVGAGASKVGVEITDSVYVVLNMRIMTRMGNRAWEQLAGRDEFTKCLHSLGDLSPDRRFICHFPEENTIWSVGSGYGGNALLGKKCLALRIASALGRQQGWMAEHMLILGVQNPRGEKHYVCGAFPSACGKTNLAMLIPPKALKEKGWKVWTVGDDIAWLRPGPDGRLWAINPEAGFFGVAPGTSNKTNENAIATASANSIFTNVALKPDGTVWWEGHHEPPVDGMLDWRGRPWDPKSGEKAAHPNSRFTAPASQCPSIAPEWEDPRGVPISAILFGARRPKVVPLVYEARDWQHGTFVGATLASETTAAATGAVGVLRRDPMAMLPFCGYHMADYFAHWLSMGAALTNPPRVFGVNWFRTNADGKFLWPGYGENLRVLEWILERCEGRGEAVETPIGNVPTSIDLDGLELPASALTELLRVDPEEWSREAASQAEFFQTYGDRVPQALWDEHAALVERTSLVVENAAS
ncbi:MAG: phosphoenolpyruvate carboxykinase (GTP) [Myxococcota bacterium]